MKLYCSIFGLLLNFSTLQIILANVNIWDTLPEKQQKLLKVRFQQLFYIMNNIYIKFFNFLFNKNNYFLPYKYFKKKTLYKNIITLQTPLSPTRPNINERFLNQQSFREDLITQTSYRSRANTLPQRLDPPTKHYFNVQGGVAQVWKLFFFNWLVCRT